VGFVRVGNIIKLKGGWCKSGMYVAQGWLGWIIVFSGLGV